MLDNIIYGFPQSLASFSFANGIVIVVGRIETMVKDIIALGAQFTLEELDPNCILDPAVDTKSRLLLTQVPLLRSLLKLILHLMQSSGSADGMRNLIDGSLPVSIRTMFHNSHLFSHAGVFGLAVNIMSTFIHNEPTCLSILQEMKLPQAFLSAAQKQLPVSAEVISAFPNAFGAISLNTVGLDMFVKSNPISNFFGLFSKEEHLSTLLDNDVPSLIGTSIDEFMRHHPSIKENVMQAIVDMVTKVSANCLLLEPRDIENARLTDPMQTVDQVAIENIKPQDSRIGLYIDVTSRFLEGLFQNNLHCKEFIKLNGVVPLLELYKCVALPFDFADSPSAYSLSFLFRVIIELAPTETAKWISDSVEQALNTITQLTQASKGQPQLQRLIFSKEESRLPDADQVLFHHLVSTSCLVRLLSDLYCSHSISQSKSTAAILAMFGDLHPDLLQRLMHLKTVCHWELYEIEERVPALWIMKLDSNNLGGGVARGEPDPVGRPTLTPISPIPAEPSPVDPLAAAATVSGAHSYSGRNTRYLHHLVTEIFSDIHSLSTGILKTICSKRLSDQSPHRAGVFALAEKLAVSIKTELENYTDEEAGFTYRMLNRALEGFFALVVEERSVVTLQTIFYSAFQKCGGQQVVMQISRRLITDLAHWKAQTQEDKKATAGIKGTNECMLMILQVLKVITSSKLVHDSQHTLVLSRDKKINSSSSGNISNGGFDQYEFLTTNRIATLELVEELLNSPAVDKLDMECLGMIMKIYVQILKQEGQVAPTSAELREGASRNTGLAASLFRRPVEPERPAARLVPNEASVAQLADMGFPRGAAERALLRCNNNLGLAADYLLTHPGAMFEPSGGNTSSTRSAAPPIVPTTTPITPAEVAIEAPNQGSFSAIVSEIVCESAVENLNTDVEMASPEGHEQLPSTAPAEPQVSKNLEILQKLCKDISETITDRACRLLEVVDSKFVFSVKELVCFVHADDITSWFAKLRLSVSALQQQLANKVAEAESQVHAALSVRLHLATLIINHKPFGAKLVAEIALFVSTLSSLLPLVDLANPQRWLSFVYLIIAMDLVIVDQPKKEKLTIKDSVGMDQDEVEEIVGLDIASKNAWIEHLIEILKVCVNKNIVNAGLRLIIALTRLPDSAQYFVDLKGIHALFTNIGLFESHYSLVMHILRQCAEDPETIKVVMAEQLQEYKSYNSTKDFSKFIEFTSDISLRNPSVFVDVVSEKFVLQDCDIARSIYHIAAAPAKPLGEPVPLNVPTVFSQEKMSRSFGPAVKYLIDELLHYRTISRHGDRSELDHHQIARQCFIIQCLCELGASYMTTKMDIMHATQRLRKAGGKVYKNQLLTYLLYDIIPQTVAPVDQLNTPEFKLRKVTSSWAASLICSLCLCASPRPDEPQYADLSNIRNFVVECISKCIKETSTAGPQSNAQSYSRLISMAEICDLLLNQFTFEGSVSFGKAKKDSCHTEMAKIMIQQNFPTLLTEIIAGLDMHHPQSKRVVEAMLNPIENLASAAVLLGKTETSSTSLMTPRAKKNMPFNNALDELTNQEEPSSAEISDMYRNSALGVLNPQSDHGMETDSYSDDDSDPDAFIQDEDDDGDMGDESEEEDEMEIVIPHPFHGNAMEDPTSTEDEGHVHDEIEEDDDEDDPIDGGPGTYPDPDTGTFGNSFKLLI